jgi:hypothetical protein
LNHKLTRSDKYYLLRAPAVGPVTCSTARLFSCSREASGGCWRSWEIVESKYDRRPGGTGHRGQRYGREGTGLDARVVEDRRDRTWMHRIHRINAGEQKIEPRMALMPRILGDPTSHSAIVHCQISINHWPRWLRLMPETYKIPPGQREFYCEQLSGRSGTAVRTTPVMNCHSREASGTRSTTPGRQDAKPGRKGIRARRGMPQSRQRGAGRLVAGPPTERGRRALATKNAKTQSEMPGICYLPRPNGLWTGGTAALGTCGTPCTA